MPMRMVKVVQTTTRHVQKGGENPVEEEIIEWWTATPCKKTAVPTQTIAKMASARWDIENVGFHDMKTYWQSTTNLCTIPRSRGRGWGSWCWR